MALPSRFSDPVSDATEDKLRLTRIPEKTQKSTAWGMRVWDDWAAACPASSDTDHDHVPVTTPLLDMPVSDLAYCMSKFVLLKPGKLMARNTRQKQKCALSCVIGESDWLKVM